MTSKEKTIRMQTFKTNADWLLNDLYDEVKLFKGYEQLDITATIIDQPFSCTVKINDREYRYSSPHCDDKKQKRRQAKLSVFCAMSDFLTQSPPWGSLTGVRPTKLAYGYIASGGSIDGVADFLTTEYFVSPEKSRLVADILRVQAPYVTDLQDKANLYINIPFCEGRCNYCSFPSATLQSDGKGLKEYTDLLIKEIFLTKQLIRDNNKTLLSIYVGGGTPTVLPLNELERLLKAIDASADIEFTFEAGRPDSIMPEKLRLLRDYGVQRICVNPQSLNDKTLLAIGRRHTKEQFYHAYELASKHGFTINTDIIAGLSDESVGDFAHTLSEIIRLAPSNLTVHTLAKKRGSMLADQPLVDGGIDEMLSIANSALRGKYSPYYLYRQKYMLGNHENIGYSKPMRECINNITVMEELVPVYACGAGGISKRCDSGSLSRYANAKDVLLYAQEFDDRMAKKRIYFKN